MNCKRREFVKLGGITLAGTVLIPPFLKSCSGIKISDNASSYLDHFEVTPGMLQEVINAAMAKGGDYADLFFEHSLNNYTSLEDNKVNSASTNVSYGVGIRVLKGDQTGYAFSENITAEEMLKAAPWERARGGLSSLRALAATTYARVSPPVRGLLAIGLLIAVVAAGWSHVRARRLRLEVGRLQRHLLRGRALSAGRLDHAPPPRRVPGPPSGPRGNWLRPAAAGPRGR